MHGRPTPGPLRPLGGWLQTLSLLAALALTGPLLPGAAHAARADSLGALPISWHILPGSLCPGDTVRLRVDLCGPCAEFRAVELADSGYVRIVVQVRDGVPCPLVPCPMDTRFIELGRFAAGHFEGQIRLTTIVIAADSSSTELNERFSYSFDVLPSCGTGPLPFVDSVRVTNSECPGCAPNACAGSPLSIVLDGSLPNGCWHVRSVRLLPSITPVEPPSPPVVQVVVFGPCADSLDCGIDSVAWHAEVPFGPGLAAGVYPLVVRVLQYSCHDSTIAPQFFQRQFSYEVVDCPPSSGCVEPFLVPVLRDSMWEACATIVGPAQRGRVEFAVAGFAHVAGLQGKLVLGSDRLQIETIDAVPAGFRVAWQRTPDGASYLLFSDSGASVEVNGLTRMLRVSVGLVGPGAPPRVPLAGGIEVAADPAGGEVGFCIHIVPPNLPHIAWLCAPGAGCDVNHDGSANVRDLVLMVRCLIQPGYARDSSCVLAMPDCDQNGTFDLADVLCCARSILRGGGTDTTQALPAPGVGVAFGVPTGTVTGVDLPVLLEGAGSIGAASISLDFPADRFDVAGVKAEGDDTGWLVLHELDGNRVRIGAIRIAPIPPDGASTVPLTLSLRLRDGQEAGGSVSLEGGEFSSPAGARLDVPITPIATALGGPAATAMLSPALPNPTGGETRFVVNLPRAASADLAIVDLAGRRVATLHRGPLAAGQRTFVWDGRGAANGVYFARLVVDGQTVARRVTLLRGR